MNANCFFNLTAVIAIRAANPVGDITTATTCVCPTGFVGVLNACECGIVGDELQVADTYLLEGV